MSGPEPADFRRALGQFVTGVTIATTVRDGVRHGMTVNAFASLSLDPLLVLVCVDHAAGMHDLLVGSGMFAVTVLAEEQEHLSAWFASAERPKGTEQFDGVAWRPAPVTGCPVLEGGLAYVDCHVHGVYAGGDHSIFVGAVVAVGDLEGARPLVFFEGGYRRLAPGYGAGAGQTWRSNPGVG